MTLCIMHNTKVEFDKRIEEINTYFQLLTTIDRGDCQIHCRTIDGGENVEPINVELVKILKANGFLLLYNLIEATIRKSLEAIFSAIHLENLTFQQLSDNLKKLWINQKTLPLKEGIDAVTYDKIRGLLEDVAKSIIDNQIMQLETECIRISGNIDARSIREIAAKIGFEQSRDGSLLETIKNKRNHLAHGEFTFGEIGKEVSVNDMIRFKDNTCTHLTDVLNNIEDYIVSRKFMK